MSYLPLDVKGKKYRVFSIDSDKKIESIDSDNIEDIYIYTESMSRKGYEVDMYEWDTDIDMYIPF